MSSISLQKTGNRWKWGVFLVLSVVTAGAVVGAVHGLVLVWLLSQRSQGVTA